MNLSVVKTLLQAFLVSLISNVWAVEDSTYQAAPNAWQMSLQKAASPMMEGIHGMHDYLLFIISMIMGVVSALLGYVIYRYRAKKNRVPSQQSRHIVLEVVWTIIPAIIIVLIAIPSIKLMYHSEKNQNPELTIKAIGHQWYWSYEYPSDKLKPLKFDSHMLEDTELKAHQIRLLDVDQRMIVPIDTTVQLLITGADVLHSFAVPSLGIKRDALPGRINETWFRIHQKGIYYGQCSELCGIKHGYMPIAIEAVDKDTYTAWRNKKDPDTEEVKEPVTNTSTEPKANTKEIKKNDHSNKP